MAVLGRPAPDITGQRFGHLTVLSRLPNRVRDGVVEAQWLCLCDCGEETAAGGCALRRGDRKSCGCMRGGKRTSARQRRIKLIDPPLLPA